MLKDLMLTDYFTEVYADVETILDEKKPDTIGEAKRILDNSIDEITGEISGSYDCNTRKAQEKVLNEFGMLLDAFNWFSVSTTEAGEWFLDECWETMDVVIRQYVYSYALEEMFEMWKQKYDEN